MIVITRYVVITYDLRMYQLNQYPFILFIYDDIGDQLSEIEV